MIHRRLFLSRKGCRVSPLCSHWRWVNLCTCQSTAHKEHEFSAEFSGKMWLTTGFLSVELEYWASWLPIQWFITKIQSPSPPASWPLTNCKIPDCSSLLKYLFINVFREWKSRLLSCSQAVHWKYPTFQVWNPGSVDGYMSCIVLFLIPGWASCVTNHIWTSIHFELHVHVCNLEYAFGKY